MHAHFLAGILILANLVFLSPCSFGADSGDEISEIRQELEKLREGQKRLEKELAELRKLVAKGQKKPSTRPPFEPQDLTVGPSATLGEMSAPVTIFNYSDFQCPYCQRYAHDVLPHLLSQYVEQGKVRLVMRENPITQIHPRAMPAAVAAVCAGEQGRYQGMYDLLFTDRKKLSDEDIQSHALNLELDMAAFNSCLQDGAAAAKQVNADVQEAKKLGVSGTPGFIIGRTDPDNPDLVHVNEYLRGARPYPHFQSAIDEQLRDINKANAE